MNSTSASTLKRDPVCGMSVDPATSQHRFDYHGETFHFCSAGCRTKFAADPGQYLDSQVLLLQSQGVAQRAASIANDTLGGNILTPADFSAVNGSQ